MNISGGWRLLWAAKLTCNLRRLLVQIEWGPPIIWRPRYASYAFDSGRAWQFGLGWWIVIIGLRK